MVVELPANHRLEHGRCAQFLRALYEEGDRAGSIEHLAARFNMMLLNLSRHLLNSHNEYNIEVALVVPATTINGPLPSPEHAADVLKQPVPQHIGELGKVKFPVYLIVAGTNPEILKNVQACAQVAWEAGFWSIGAYREVAKLFAKEESTPEVLLKCQSNILTPWVEWFKDKYQLLLQHWGYSGIQVNLVGHSLGGAIVDAAVLMLPHAITRPNILDLDFCSISFDSPGVPDVLLKQYCQDPEAVAGKMTSYLASPNPINTLCKHPGTVYHILRDNLPEKIEEIAGWILLDVFRCWKLYKLGTAIVAKGALIVEANAAGSASGRCLGTLATKELKLSGNDVASASGLVGGFGFFATQLGMEAWELRHQHSMAYLGDAFDSSTRKPVVRYLRRMVEWPLLTPHANVWAGAKRFASGLLPSFVCQSNLGVMTWWMGKYEYQKQRLSKMPGYKPA